MEFKVGDEKIELNIAAFMASCKESQEELNTCELSEDEEEEQRGFLLKVQTLSHEEEQFAHEGLKEPPDPSIELKQLPFIEIYFFRC